MLASAADRYPLLLELREPAEMGHPIDEAKRVAGELLTKAHTQHER